MRTHLCALGAVEGSRIFQLRGRVIPIGAVTVALPPEIVVQSFQGDQRRRLRGWIVPWIICEVHVNVLHVCRRTLLPQMEGYSHQGTLTRVVYLRDGLPISGVPLTQCFDGCIVVGYLQSAASKGGCARVEWKQLLEHMQGCYVVQRRF